MFCVHGLKAHSTFKEFGRDFVEFWHDYFQSTGLRVQNLPIKYFMSAADLVNLSDLSMCTCINLVEKLYPKPKLPYLCRICRKRFPTKSTWENHKITQHKKPNYACVFCNKTSITKVALLRHMELHTREYECKVCNQALNLFNFERHNETGKHQNNIRRLNKKTKKKTSIE